MSEVVILDRPDLSSATPSVTLFQCGPGFEMGGDWLAIALLFGWDHVDMADVIDQEDCFELRRHSHELLFYKSSRSFWWQQLPRFKNEQTLSLPLAIKIARRLFGPDELQYASLAVSGIRSDYAARICEDQAARNILRETHKYVQIRITLEGLDVLGPGAKVRIAWDGDELQEVYKFWRFPLKLYDVQAISESDALNLMLDAEEFRHIRDADVTVVIKRSSLGYFSFPPRQRQTYFIPVYAFEVTLQGSAAHGFTQYVQALPPDVRDAIDSWPELPSLFQ